MYYLDYSGAKLSGETIKAAGYGGAIRYIAAGREEKQTDLNEYRSHINSGLDIYFVCQAGTTDADQGFSRGAELARLAKTEADSFGYPSGRIIFFTNDRPELPNASAWRSYLDGAASILGADRIGAYGFANAIDAAQGHAVAFWQAGRKSDVRPFVNFWQDNNTQVFVGGIECDRNLVLVPMPEGGDDLNINQDNALTDLGWRLMAVLSGWEKIPQRADIPQRLWNQPVQLNATINDAAWRVLAMINGWTEIPEQPGIPERLWHNPVPVVGAINALRTDVDALTAKVNELSTPTVDVDESAIAIAVAQQINLGNLTPEQVRLIVEESIVKVTQQQWNK